MPRPTKSRRPEVRLTAAVPGRARLAGVVAVGTVMALLAPAPALAQTFEGRVVDEAGEAPVATALVRLVDEAGEQRAVTVADSSGQYHLDAPGPGVYRLQAERIGYEGLETPLLEAPTPDGAYPVDLLMRRSPIPIAGLEVSTEQVDRQLHQIMGISPRALRWRPIRHNAVLRHVERAHDLTDVMRWGNYAGIEVREPRLGEPCYHVRRYGCLDVYLDGFRLTPETYDLVPLEAVRTIVVVHPSESITFPRGAVLMYTPGWLRQ